MFGEKSPRQGDLTVLGEVLERPPAAVSDPAVKRLLVEMASARIDDNAKGGRRSL